MTGVESSWEEQLMRGLDCHRGTERFAPAVAPPADLCWAPPPPESVQLAEELRRITERAMVELAERAAAAGWSAERFAAARIELVRVDGQENVVRYQLVES